MLGRGEGAVIDRGTALRIQAASRTLIRVLRGRGEKPTKPASRRCAPTRTSSRPTRRRPRCCSARRPQCRSDNVFTDESREYLAGTWDSTPYHRIVRAHRLNEFMYLLAGSVRFAAPDGSVLSAGTGDALFVPQGAPIGWESSDRVAKFYVCQTVPA